MAKTLTTILSLLFIWTTSNKPIHEPHFLESPIPWDRIDTAEYISSFPSTTTESDFALYILKDQKGEPLFFYSALTTPVCIDNICKPVDIEIYWDLVGQYIGLAIDPEKPLTKYDHEVWVEEDYEKLHALLQNKHSILNRKSLDNLYDLQANREDTIRFNGQEVDAITGATKKEIKAHIIDGALYSCYAVWQIAHGPVRDSIRSFIDSTFDQIQWLKFLYSENREYQYKGLQNLTDTALHDHAARIIEVLPQSKPVARTYALKKLPIPFWRNAAFVQGVYSNMGVYDVFSNTILINKLSIAEPIGLLETSKHISHLTKNQLTKYLSFIRPEMPHYEQIAGNLKDAFSTSNYRYKYLLESFMD